jgi:hypothetical protein
LAEDGEGIVLSPQINPERTTLEASGDGFETMGREECRAFMVRQIVPQMIEQMGAAERLMLDYVLASMAASAGCSSSSPRSPWPS